MSVQVQSFFHRDSNTFSYLVSDPASGEAALIDPVLDYDPDTDASSEAPPAIPASLHHWRCKSRQ